MSSRALRRLREEQELSQQPTVLEEGSEDESSDDDDVGAGRGSAARGGGFSAMMMMDSESESDSDCSESDPERLELDSELESQDSCGGGDRVGDGDDLETERRSSGLQQGGKDDADGDGNGGDNEEDIDAILSEFQFVAMCDGPARSLARDAPAASSGTAVLLSGIDPRDLDLDRSMGSMLGGGGGGAGVGRGGNLGLDDAQDQQRAQLVRNHPAIRGRNQRGMRPGIGRGATHLRKFVFVGRPAEAWGRPPSHIGGGLGIDILAKSRPADSATIPWPYSTLGGDGGTDVNPYRDARWHSFLWSDSYAAQCADYEMVAGSGDANALAMFVADNPYHAEASLQLSSVLFHTNSREDAMELLKRVLWIYEFAAPASFLPGGGGGSLQPALMDQTKEENAGYFSALSRLMRTSCMVGCVGTSLAVARYILSLDPLRDPMGVLLTMDYFALASLEDEHARFVVDLVESETVQIHHMDGDGERHCCDLIDFPNWSFAYALALHRLKHSKGANDCIASQRADEALKSALTRSPFILELLLEKIGVDVTRRSTRVDWPPVVAHFREMSSALKSGSRGDEATDNAIATAAVAHVVKIFVQRSHKLWKSDHVQNWLYSNCAAILREGVGVSAASSFHPALAQYMRCDPSDYEDSFQTLPADANPLDPALVAPALALDPNRRRMRRFPRGGGMANNADLQNREFERLFAHQAAAGGRAQMIDPDLPLVEVFWRSLMPWNEVEGVGPPPPPG